MSAQPDFDINTVTQHDALCAIVGSEHVRRATSDDAIDRVQPHFVVEPGSNEEIAGVLKFANEAGLAVAPRGNGTKSAWGNQPRSADLVLSTTRLNRIIEHAWEDLTVTVEAGCTVERLQSTLAEHGQRLAIDVLWPELATIGGILATNDSGALRIRFGGLRDIIIGVTLVLPDGTIACSGGKVVKNVAGYDLMKLATGSLGTLALISRAVFRVHPIPHEQRTVSFSTSDFDQAARFVLDICGSNLTHTGLQLRAGSFATPSVDVRFEGTTEGIEAQLASVRRLATALKDGDRPIDVWKARQQLWDDVGTELVVKLTFLPSELGRLCHALDDICTKREATWRMVAQGHGIAYVRMRADMKNAVEVLQELRRLQISGGSVVLLSSPTHLKQQVEVWGDPGDTLPITRRIKQQFDSNGILNPGRFIGGI